MKKIAQNCGDQINVRPRSVETKLPETGEEETEMSNLLRASPNAGANTAGLVNQVYATLNSQEDTRSPADQGNQVNLQPDVEIVDPRNNTRTVVASSAAAVAPRPQPAATNPSPERDDDSLDEMEEEIVLKYGATHLMKILVPVTLCMVFVIISLTLITSYQSGNGQTLLYTPFNEDSQESSGTKLWMSIANASIFIGVVIVMTVVLIILYKYRWYKTISVWLAISSAMLLFLFNFMFITELFKQFNVVTDMLTVMLFIWNFGVLGMLVIHWKGPLKLQQIFLIYTCIQMALIFIKYLPTWTTWVLLAFISIWDLVAVLCPFGPLRILVETAQSRNDTLFPAMIYSSTVAYLIGMAKSSDKTQESTRMKKSSRSDSSNGGDREERANATSTLSENEDGSSAVRTVRTGSTGQSARRRPVAAGGQQAPSANAEDVHHHQHLEELEHQQQEEEENGAKLGLGDFIFYSILVGKASILGDWNTVIACVIAILIGLCLTLVLLAIFHKALPALPISLFFGLIFYFSTNLVVRPFYDELTSKQVFI